MTNRRVLPILALSAAAAAAHAEVPRLLGYQGRLLRADGTSATGTATVTFGLFEAATGGTPLWTESQTLGLSDGYYATFLGLATPAPDALPDGGARWLDVRVGSEPLSPRQQLGAVPYALAARSLAGGPADVSSLRVDGALVLDASGRLAGSARYVAGPGIAIDEASQTVALAACASGQVLLRNDSTWACTPAATGTVVSVSALAPLAVAGGAATPQLSLAQAGAGSGGYLSSADWNAFNTKYGALTQCGGDLSGPLSSPAVTRLQSRAVAAAAPAAGQVLKWNGAAAQWEPAADLDSGGTVTEVTALAPLAAYNGVTTPQLSIAQAAASADGYLSSGDWSRFNAKYDAASQCSGDLAGVWAAPQVTKLQGVGVSTTAPSAAQVLRFDGSGWAPSTLAPQDVSGLASGYVDLTGAQTVSGAKTFSSAPVFSTPLAVAGGGTGASTAFAQGSVVFAGNGGVYSQSTELSWNETDRRLGVGTSAPSADLDVGATTGGGALRTVLARLPEGNGPGAGSSLGVRAWGTSPVGTTMFSLEQSFYGLLNSSVEFHRGGDQLGGFLAFTTGNGTERLRVDGSGRVGVGTTEPGWRLDVAGEANASGLCIAGDCRAGWSQVGGFWSSSGSGIYNSTGSAVGIGTSTPGAALEVNGALLVANGAGVASRDESAAPRTMLETASDGSVRLYGYHGASLLTGVNGATYLYGSGGYVNVQANMGVGKVPGAALDVSGSALVSGSVGIGTTSPASTLHVAGAARVTGGLVYAAGDGNDWWMKGTANGPALLLRQNGTTGGAAARRGSLGWMDNNGVYYENLTWDGASVGVGTTAPQATLDVGGSALFGYDAASATTLTKSFATAHAAANVPSSLSSGVVDGGGVAGMTVSNVRDGSFNSQSISFGTHHGGVSSGTRMTIDKDGAVGIGTTTPATRLDVAGAVRVANDATGCTSTNAGAVRFASGRFQGCTGSEWRYLEKGSDGSSQAQAAPSCLALRNSGVLRPDGTYWLAPDGNTSNAFQVQCDMATDGGGWTVLVNHPLSQSTQNPLADYGSVSAAGSYSIWSKSSALSYTQILFRALYNTNLWAIATAGANGWNAPVSVRYSDASGNYATYASTAQMSVSSNAPSYSTGCTGCGPGGCYGLVLMEFPPGGWCSHTGIGFGLSGGDMRGCHDDSWKWNWGGSPGGANQCPESAQFKSGNGIVAVR